MTVLPCDGLAVHFYSFNSQIAICLCYSGVFRSTLHFQFCRTCTMSLIALLLISFCACIFSMKLALVGERLFLCMLWEKCIELGLSFLPSKTELGILLNAILIKYTCEKYIYTCVIRYSNVIMLYACDSAIFVCNLYGYNNNTLLTSYLCVCVCTLLQ